jgi:hypothetical protein
MARDDDEVELLIPIDGGEIAQDPFNVRSRTRLVEHRLGGVEPAQSPVVTGLPGSAQQLTRPAPDIQHRLGCHHHRQIEAEVAALLPRAEHVVQLGETWLGERPIDHHASLPCRAGLGMLPVDGSTDAASAGRWLFRVAGE